MSTLPRADTKIDRVLTYFSVGGELNFIEAQQKLHDRSLHSTVSALQNKYGINISRKDETVAGYQGNPTLCKRYWIDLDERIRIEQKRANLKKQKTPNITDQDNKKGLSNER